MSNGRKHYKQLVDSNFAGVRDKIKEARKNPRNNRNKRRRK